MFLDKALRSLGYEPVVTATGQEAIDRATEGDYAALLCDHQMAGLSGIDIYAAITAARPALARRYVLMSGDVLNPAIEAFVADHHVGVLAKPFDFDTLERVVRMAMTADDEGPPDQPRG